MNGPWPWRKENSAYPHKGRVEGLHTQLRKGTCKIRQEVIMLGFERAGRASQLSFTWEEKVLEKKRGQ